MRTQPRMNSNSKKILDDMTEEEVRLKAQMDGVDFCEQAKISELKEIEKTGCNIAYINFMKDIDFVCFNIHENPFGIYDKVLNEAEQSKLKAINYSFPQSAVSANTKIYFEELYRYIDENFRFDEIKGKTEFKDNKNKTSGQYKGVRPFFTMPTESQMENPPFIGTIRIEPHPYTNRQPPTSYNFTIKKEKDMISDITCLKDLIEYLPKRSSYRVYIRPVKMSTAYKSYGSEYKIVWKAFGFSELTTRVNPSLKIKQIFTEELDDDEEEEEQSEINL